MPNPKRPRVRRSGRTARPSCEALESRRVLTDFNFVGDTLFITGGPGDDRVVLRNYEVDFYLELSFYVPSTCAKIVADLGDGNDSFSLSTHLFPDLPWTQPIKADGGPGNDRITGGPADDTLSGGAGNDELDGFGGDDTLDGGDGNDILDGGSGLNTLVSGPGNDVYNFTSNDGPVTFVDNDPVGADQIAGSKYDDVLTLGGGSSAPSSPEYIWGYGGNDTLRAGPTRSLLDGGPGDDKLFGGGGADEIHGGDGNDSIDGGGADDLLLGEDGDDTIDGGPGNDYLHSGTGFNTLVSGPGNDTYNFFYNSGAVNFVDNDSVGVDIIYGSAFDDTLTLGGGSSNSSKMEEVWGNDGKDTLRGGSTRNLIHGGNGDDKLYGGPLSDEIYGEDGNDYAEGGAGGDLISGDIGDDTIKGGDGDDQLYGQSGDDTINGDAGNDTIYGQSGADNLFGDAGNDYLSGDDASLPAGNDVIHGGIGDDTLIGWGGDDMLYGEAGFDSLDASPPGIPFTAGGRLWSNDPTEGNDTLDGGPDTDFYVFYHTTSPQHDVVVEARGAVPELDALDFRQLPASDGVTVNLRNGTASYPNHVIDLRGDGATANIEQVACGPGNDDVRAEISRPIVPGQTWSLNLTTGAGDDILEGGPGDDRLNGGAGNDTFIFWDVAADNTPISAGGNDAVVEGADADTDTLDFSKYLGKSLKVDLGLTTTQTMPNSSLKITFSDARGIEDVKGSPGDDIIVGNARNNRIYGDKGVDVLFGGGGDDELHGGEGNDALFGDDFSGNFGGPADHFAWAAQFAAALGTGNSKISWNASASFFPVGSGADKLFGEQDNDFMVGGPGNDTIDGGTGRSVIVGDAFVVFGAVDVSLAMLRTTGTLGTALDLGGDLFGHLMSYDLKMADSGVGDDILTGSVETDWIEGGAGNDVIDGKGGGDVLLGGAGNDRLTTGPGDPSILFGGPDDDILTGGPDRDILFGDDYQFTYTTFTLTGDEAWDRMLSGLAKGKLVLPFAVDFVPHGSGNDTINGNGGVDWIFGGAGNDTIDGGDGGDLIYGDGLRITTEDAQGAEIPFGDLIVAAVGTAINPLVGAAVAIWKLAKDKLVFDGSGDDTIQGGAGSDLVFGGGGKDAIDGGAGLIDLLFGNDGADTIIDEHGLNVMFGNEGDDYLQSGAVGSLIMGDGLDLTVFDLDVATKGDTAFDAGRISKLTLSFTGKAGSGAFETGNGNDTLIADGGTNLLIGGAGDDKIQGGNYANVMIGDAIQFGVELQQQVVFDYDRTVDFLDGVNVSMVLGLSKIPGFVGNGKDTIGAAGGVNFAYGGGGADLISGGFGLLDVLVGGDDDDVIAGGTGMSVLVGGGGSDKIFAPGVFSLIFGDEVLLRTDLELQPLNPVSLLTEPLSDILAQPVLVPLASGDDTIVGGPGPDLIFGGDGADRINAGDGLNFVVGDSLTPPIGRKTLSDLATEAATDKKLLESVVDALMASRLGGADTIIGGNDVDILLGGGGNDTLLGNGGSDILLGQDGDDHLEGGSGLDFLFGGAGNDYLDGGGSYDILVGGTGADRFRFTKRYAKMTALERYLLSLVVDYDPVNDVDVP